MMWPGLCDFMCKRWSVMSLIYAQAFHSWALTIQLRFIIQKMLLVILFVVTYMKKSYIFSV